MSFTVTAKRSVVKSITFRILVMIADGFIVYALTKSYQVALGVIIFSNISSTIIFYFHERVWNRVSWGRKGGRK